MKHELLVPVGNYDCLIAAINNGADAVYLGGKKFGARAFADNFTLEDIKKATKLCHLYGVKIYVTVNTIIYESEIKEAYEYIKALHKIGVDALIMQDIGLINLVHKTLPNLTIHASTQMHNHSEESLNFLKDLGIKRVVFARELSLNYINSINTSLEKEVFIHGSLCISYSGQCLFSKAILDRSGNRGECAGMCRLPYKLYENNKLIETNGDYLLSPKDLCSVDDFKKLLDSNILCFKIEGRMKSASYVALVTKIYHDLIEQYENKEELKIDEETFNLLKAVFNREYTKGYLFDDDNIMNFIAPNHKGIEIGKVIKVTKNKIKIKLSRDLKQFEGIRFKNSNLGININFMYDENDKLISKASKNSIIYLDNFVNLKELDTVLLTNPVIDLPKTITKKIKVNIKFFAKKDKHIKLKVSDGENEVEVQSDILVEIAKDNPITKDRIELSLKKTGNTPFMVDNITFDIENNLFIPVGILNNLRRQALEKLQSIRENKKVLYIEKEFQDRVIQREITHNINILVRTKEQLKACRDLNVKNIIVNNTNLMEDDLIYQVPRTNLKHDYNYPKLLVTDYASLYKYRNNLADYYLNICNHYSLNYINKYSSSVCLSVECNEKELKNIMANYKNNINVEILLYGNIELMIMKYCPLKNILNKNQVCNICQNKNKYYLQDRNKAFYRIVTNSLNHSTTILNTNKTDLINKMPEFKKMGITNFRIELLDENYEETKKLIERVRKIYE